MIQKKVCPLGLRKIKVWLLKYANPYYIEKLQILTTYLFYSWGRIHKNVLYIINVDFTPKELSVITK